jgi:soluble lytic murein transglycosylase-like protein
MRAINTIVFAALLLSRTAYAQRSFDPFDQFHNDIAAVAAQQAAAARGEHHEREALHETDPPISPVPDNGLERLRQLKPLIGGIFDEYGVPQEFLLVGLVESGYRTNAVSSADAVGMWQFVESTARRFGLIDASGDHRSDLVRSTHAAAAYLKFLLGRYKDWRLALAAYNAGEERVDRAITAAGSTDFSANVLRMFLPEETLNYVPAVLRRMAEARSAGLIQSGN